MRSHRHSIEKWSCAQPTTRGVTSLEMALLMPFVFLFLLFALQIAFIVVSHQLTQYAAYMAARSYLVYGPATLQTIDYPYTAAKLGSGGGAGLLTRGSQSVAEATAEKILFESLPWEHHRITVTDENDWYMRRLYADGIDGGGASLNRGAVRVQFGTDPVLHNVPGVELTYCMPVLFTGLDRFFSLWQSPNPCEQIRSIGLEKPARGIPIQYAYYLGREP